MPADPTDTEPTTAAARRAPGARAPRAIVPKAVVVATVAGALVVGIGLRFASRVDLWLDETLTVNIARRPLADLPGALRHDGAPPLFYALLHFWSRLFGSGDVAVRALPGLCGVAMIPLAYACGRRIARRGQADPATVGIAAALIVALAPFAVRYSTETRMYALAMALVLLGLLCIWRALDDPAPPRLALLAVVTAALLYTSYWCAYLVAVVIVILGLRSLPTASGEPRAARRVLAATIAGCALFLPWAPSLFFQLRHTGTPWGGRPRSITVVPSALAQLSGGHHVDGRILSVVILLLALVGFRGRGTARWAVRWECLVGAATLLFGLGLAEIADSAFEVRYAAIVFPFLALAAAYGAALLPTNVRVGALALVVGLGISVSFHVITQPRTQAGEIAAALRSHAHVGDVVLYCPDQVAPDTSRKLSTALGLRQFTFPGFGSPDRVDWVDYAKRNGAADPEAFAAEAVARAGSSRVWLVWSPGYLTYGDKCDRLQAALAARRGVARTIVPGRDVFEHMSLVGFGDRANP